MIGIEVRNPFISHPENFPRRCPGFDLQFRPPQERGNFYLDSEGSLRKADEEVENNVITIARENFMRFLFNDHNEIARGSPALSGVTLSAQWYVISF